MPVLVAKGEHIDQELKIVHSWFAHHLNLVVHIKACQIVQHLRQSIKIRLHTVTVGIVLLSRLTAYLYREIDALMETWHIVVAGTQLDTAAYLAGYIDTDTCGSGNNRHIEILKDLILLEPRLTLATVLCLSHGDHAGGSNRNHQLFHILLIYFIFQRPLRSTIGTTTSSLVESP